MLSYFDVAKLLKILKFMRMFIIFSLCFAVHFATAQDGLKFKELVEAARQQVGVTIEYDPAYVILSYPGGDVPKDRGVCTDVVVRALRKALNIDLQKCVHEDMQRDFSSYPKNWGLSKPDKNIDHRRVPNLQTYFKRHFTSLEPSQDESSYHVGDLVTSMLPGNLPHIMIVSDKTTFQGTPLVIHNIGRGTVEEDCLFRYPITGHYRLVRKPTKT